MAAMPYKVSRDPKWTRSVYDGIVGSRIKLLVRTDDATAVTVSGPCPNCKHQFTDTDILTGATDAGGVLDDGVEKRRLSPREESVELPPATLRCTCTKSHPQRPHGTSGCGIYFTVTATKDKSS